MHAFLPSSLSRTLRMVLLVVMAIALFAMASAILLLMRTQDDARAINVSGSLRMQNYRLAHAVATGAPSAYVAELRRQFATSLSDPSLFPYVGTSLAPPSPLAATIHRNWQLTQQRLDSGQSGEVHTAVAAVVAAIDALVADIQAASEAKVRELLVIQGICLIALIVVSSALLLFFQRRLVRPLETLTTAASHVEKRQFELDLPPFTGDEMGTLSAAFAQMASELQRLYSSLENEVAAKTQALRHANAGLALLYECARKLQGGHVDEPRLLTVLESVRTFTGLYRLRLVLEDEHGVLPALLETSADQDTGQDPLASYRWPIADGDHHFGYLAASGQPNADSDTTGLLASLAQLLGQRLEVDHLLHAEHQSLVQEERATIARELHDSLAQTLSTIRFKLTVLRHHLPDDADNCHEQLNNLEQVCASAYRHLRELLATFRLSVATTRLDRAIEAVIGQLGQNYELPIACDYQLAELALPPARFIHVLQIVREAVMNAIKHGRPSHIAIAVTRPAPGSVCVTVEDDGCGIDMEIAQAGYGHFGLDIMRERARSLGGNLDILRREPQGTRVQLVFTDAATQEPPPCP